MLDGIHIKRIRGEATICLADGQPLYGTDTYGDLDAIRSWLSTILGARGEEVFRDFADRETDAIDRGAIFGGGSARGAAVFDGGRSSLHL